ncbi:MAG: inverse autotransporter beta domain-containing protein [Chlamydiae bacterium]|nr:inverse autotransporter beta domain-containing protein [Chlamydiota bacterium]
MSRAGFAFWLSTMCAFTICQAAEQDNSCLENSPRPMRVAARYTSPKGIGYQTGYTTLEGFFSSMVKDKWLPFVDLRGHVFDNGKFAANAGMGVRYLTSSRVWGMNTYYDYRNTKHQHYNQVALGLESLGRVWDGRINGYLPVGWKQSPYYHTEFQEFKGHSMFLRSSREFAFKGINAEAGFHLDHFKKAPLYFAAGPYYLTGKGASAWGGQLRASVDLFHRYLRLEANTSYDSFFKWIGQGQISVNYSFGKKIKKRDCNRPSLYERAVQRIDRFEIIPVGKDHVETEAINPVTHEPYYFAFVDNTSHSLGTFESPYSTLATAEANTSPAQVIYVFPGDGTSTNMDLGITLQDSQMLLGASTIQPMVTTLGSVSIPAFASSLPVMTNTLTAPVITLGNNNTVSGIYIENNTSNGIYGNAVNNFTASGNTFIGGYAATVAGEAILLNDISGLLTVNDNLFSQYSSQAASSNAIHLVQTTAQCDADLINNTIACQYDGTHSIGGILAELSGASSIGTLNISGGNISSLVNNNTGDGIHVTFAGTSSISSLNISDVDLSYWNNGVEVDLSGSGSIGNITLSKTNIANQQYQGFAVSHTGSGSIASVTFQDGSINNGGSSAYGMEVDVNSSGGIENITVTNSELNRNNEGFYTIVDGSGSIGDISIKDCVINYSQDTGVQADIVSGSIGNLTVSNSTINYSTQFGIWANMKGAGSLGNLTVSNSTIDYSQSDGISIAMSGPSSGSVGNLTVSNSNIDYSSSSAIKQRVLGSGSIGNFVVSNSTFVNNPYGFDIGVSSALSIPTMSVSNSNFLGVEYAIYTANNSGLGTIGSLGVNNCTFVNNSYALFLSNTAIDSLNLSSNTFVGNQLALDLNSIVSQGAIVDNVCSGSAFGSMQVIAPNSSVNSLSFAGNVFNGISSFTSASPIASGYAVSVTGNAVSTTCLNFVDNIANPTSIGIYGPYLFNATGSTINLTAESTQANNVGTISTTGTVNPPGSCTQ